MRTSIGPLVGAGIGIACSCEWGSVTDMPSTVVMKFSPR